MKKRLFTILAVAAMAFVGCSKDDDKTIDNLEEKIIGKWMVADMNGQSVMTNEKDVLTFVSTTKAYVSASLNANPEAGSHWNDQKEVNVAINGNKMTLTSHDDEHTTAVEEYTVTAINGSEFTANRNGTLIVDGSVVSSADGVFRYTKQTADYRTAILGLWECQELTGIETYNDANARLEFFADGTYNYWHKNDGGEGESVTDREFQNSFVDGTLLATRWKNIGEDELREWWEIASLANGQMQWTALRQNADGTTAQQGMRWTKVQ